MPIDRSTLRASWASWYATDLRIHGPAWLQPVWTALFSTAVGTLFFVLGLSLSAIASGRWPGPQAALGWLWNNLVIAWTIGALIHFLFATVNAIVGTDRLRRLQGRSRSLYFAGIPMTGVLIGWPLGIGLIGDTRVTWFPTASPGAIGGSLLLGGLISFLFHLHFQAKARQLEAERRATEAQLRLLQGQIEPHFLFNTLANVHALIDEDPQRARSMLGAFTDYLRASLTGLRRAEVPLADELTLAEAYLRVQQTRMEQRLRVVFDIDDAARGVAVPPLLLQPLVENAVRHGIEPMIDGGQVRIVARLTEGRLRVEVMDDGQGLQPASARRGPARPGSGVALANIRDRLRTRYGSAAGLELLPRETGTCARLELPAEPHEASAADRGSGAGAATAASPTAATIAASGP